MPSIPEFCFYEMSSKKNLVHFYKNLLRVDQTVSFKKGTSKISSPNSKKKRILNVTPKDGGWIKSDVLATDLALFSLVMNSSLNLSLAEFSKCILKCPQEFRRTLVVHCRKIRQVEQMFCI